MGVLHQGRGGLPDPESHRGELAELMAHASNQVQVRRVVRHPGTVHNHMQVLGTLGLVEGITGPRGGYEPTDAAAAALGERSGDGGDAVTVAHEYERVDLTVDEIRFLNVDDPNVCRAVVRFRETVAGVGVGDPVVVGPTPTGSLVLAGEVRLFDDEKNELLLDVASAEAPVEPEADQ